MQNEPIYHVRLHTTDTLYVAVLMYQGNDEGEMYSAVSAIELTLAVFKRSGEIEIDESGESRWIEYRDGLRVDFPGAPVDPLEVEAK